MEGKKSFLRLLLGFPLADGTHEDSGRVSWSRCAVGSTFSPNMVEWVRTLDVSSLELFFFFFLTFPVHICTEQRAVLHVCSHICLCVTLTDMVFKGCDRRSRRLLARLSKPVFGVVAVTVHCLQQIKEESEAGQRAMRDAVAAFSLQKAWPDESRLKICRSLKFISASRAKAETRFCCPRPCSRSSSPTQGCRGRDVHMLL